MEPGRRRPIADTGAVANTCPEGYAPSIPVVSAGQKRLVGAFGQEAKHFGRKTVTARVLSHKGKAVKLATSYEVTNVRRPVNSVSQGNDHGKTFWFSRDQGSGFAKEEDVRIVLKPGADFIPLYRNRGVCEIACETLGEVNAITHPEEEREVHDPGAGSSGVQRDQAVAPDAPAAQPDQGQQAGGASGLGTSATLPMKDKELIGRGLKDPGEPTQLEKQRHRALLAVLFFLICE